MNRHAQWMKDELNRLMKVTQDKMNAAETPAEVDLEGARQRAFKQVYHMIERMERQAPGLYAEISLDDTTITTAEADLIFIRHTQEGATVNFYDEDGRHLTTESIKGNQNLTIQTNRIIDRYKLED